MVCRRARSALCRRDCQLFRRRRRGLEPPQLWRDHRASHRAHALRLSVLRQLRKIRAARGPVSCRRPPAGIADRAASGAAANLIHRRLVRPQGRVSGGGCRRPGLPAARQTGFGYRCVAARGPGDSAYHGLLYASRRTRSRAGRLGCLHQVLGDASATVRNGRHGKSGKHGCFHTSHISHVPSDGASPHADENRCLVPCKYTLTRIYSVEYTKRVESVFEIIAEPNRRAILSLLVSSQQSVGEIERQLRMPQPTVSKHLRVLREAGFVESTVDAQRRLYRLKPEPLQEVDAWLAPFRRFWSAHVDALERHLDRMDQSTPTKRKTRRRR